MINNIYSRTIWGLFLVAMNTFASLIKFIKQILYDLSVLMYIYTLYKEESTVYPIIYETHGIPMEEMMEIS